MCAFGKAKTGSVTSSCEMTQKWMTYKRWYMLCFYKNSENYLVLMVKL